MGAIDGFRKRLRTAMNDKGWNQKVLSERSGVHYQQIYKLLSGERPDPRFSTVKRLADALGITTDYFAEPDEDEEVEDSPKPAQKPKRTQARKAKGAT